ncbi:MAG TPA: hypothetical protein PKM65_07480 [Spirochaetota bacterium]|nr:hypothetical protein [Spirochaetota bacterium]HNT09799.1 hypothetical protein [Spirochaetota bacterium]HNV46113.1 hypothetical protein [Spirochaetota bacterium]HOS40506.1 hypothetical protein [Spirochaetota bacterium]HPI22409.1 hypothetical protein [Spirochaetota bacterium]
MAPEPQNPSQFDSLDKKTRLIKSALQFTNGDMDKAKQMASGQYNDVRVIKGKLSIESSMVYGIFIIFVNAANRYIMNLNALLVASSGVFEKSKIFDGWKTFYGDYKKYVDREGDNALGSYDFTTHLIGAIEGYNLYDHLEVENLDEITEDLKDIFKKYFKVDRVQCQIAIDPTNSLVIDAEGIPIEMPGSREGGADAREAAASVDQRMNEIESQAEHVIEGKIIVSPIKGKYINDIKAGESLKVVLTRDDEISMSVAKMTNAITEDDEFLPMKARLKAKIPLPEGGFVLYGVVAKNVLVKIIEEEDVKIEMDQQAAEKSSEKSDESRLFLYVALLCGAIIIMIILLIRII